MDQPPNVDTLVATYRKIRMAMDAETAAYEASVEKLKSQIDVVTEAILAVCKEQNVDSLRTPSGTVTRRISTRYWTSDWSGMYDFIKDHGAPQLLEQRIHRTNMKQFLEENPGVEPVGLNIDRRYAITVRKPTEK